jgi:isopenicillin N synthase-like dioxygenase
MKILADENNRGYTPYQEETLNPALQAVGDTKEGLYFGREVPKGDPEAEVPLHGPNQWPDPLHVPLFRPIVMQYYEACTQVAFRYAPGAPCSLTRVQKGRGGHHVLHS